MPRRFSVFYLVGLALFMVPATRELFVSITWVTLLLVTGAVFLFHRDWNAKTVGWFLFIAVSSFLLEVYGIRTGIPFGDYRYDRALGMEVEGTPLIIGINWLFLVYASHDWAGKLSRTAVGRVLAGCLLMVGYDAVMEWVAPVMRMWHFDGPYPPLSNFAAWFAAAAVYHTGFELLGIRTDNLPARALFGLQFLFFLLIGLYAHFFIR